MKLIAGLGNPGREYDGTRHNIGFAIVDHLAESCHVSFDRERFHAFFAKLQIGSETVILLKPQSYMNRSGTSVGDYLQYLKLSPEQMLVIHDDLDYPLGTLRLSFDSGAAGHRGVESIIERMGSQEFYRLRCGIGRSTNQDPVDYVLSRFDSDESKKVEDVLEKGVAASQMWVLEGAEKVQQKLHATEGSARGTTEGSTRGTKENHGDT